MKEAPKRPAKLRRIGVPVGRDLDAVASAATYIGSPEHKDTPSFAGHPQPRKTASICDRNLARDRDRPQQWLELGIRRGTVSDRWEGSFPRFVWCKVGDTVYEARLVNRVQGSYKGWPLSQEEWPPGIEDFYG